MRRLPTDRFRCDNLLLCDRLRGCLFRRPNGWQRRSDLRPRNRAGRPLRRIDRPLGAAQVPRFVGDSRLTGVTGHRNRRGKFFDRRRNRGRLRLLGAPDAFERRQRRRMIRRLAQGNGNAKRQPAGSRWRIVGLAGRRCDMRSRRTTCRRRRLPAAANSPLLFFGRSRSLRHRQWKRVLSRKRFNERLVECCHNDS